MRTVLVRVAGVLLIAFLLGWCNVRDEEPVGSGRPSIVVTTNILGDVVENIVGDQADVEVLMPPGQDPHELAPSPRQVASMREADVLIENGGGLEVALADAIDAAANDGVTVIRALDSAGALSLADGDTVDPHFFGDPARMRNVVESLALELAQLVPALDTGEYQARVNAYVETLEELDAEAAEQLATIPAARRKLVTNHDVLAYFADRYGFEVIGVIIPGGSTLAEPSAASLADLADDIDRADVPAIFAETSSPARLAEALAAEGTDVTVVELHTESLSDAGGPAPTYLEMVRANVAAIVTALGGGAT